jgi:hypothetical protein
LVSIGPIFASTDYLVPCLFLYDFFSFSSFWLLRNLHLEAALFGVWSRTIRLKRFFQTFIECFAVLFELEAYIYVVPHELCATNTTANPSLLQQPTPQ